ncbi:MAG: DUF1722 domain-containing protein [Methanophagales archaeon ANME-1-THS]|nr:MAG: DUF1722 domain-containing protein [Methanophagales archaeon ANME-1-THS]
MKEEIKPQVVVSRCLGFDACRYNGQIIPDKFVETLREYVHFTHVCPEVAIGLGVPREPIRLVQRGGEIRLLQPATGRDVSEEMRVFAERFLAELKDIDGFILKNRSPSCGIKDVRIYQSMERGPVAGKGAGFFGGMVMELFPGLAIEDEGRLINSKIREHFLTKLYLRARFRQARASRDLLAFHTENKLLLMCYNQKELKTLGRIAANNEKKKVEEVLREYEMHLQKAMARAPRCTSTINVLMHVFGFFKREISTKEKAFFLETVEKYRNGQMPLGSVLMILHAWIVRFEDEYLMKQTFFEPYPMELVRLAEECRCSEE